MQIMNLDKFFKNLNWFFGASKVLNNFPDAIVYVNNSGYVTQMNRKAGELFAVSDGESVLLLDDFIKNGMDLVKFSAKSKRTVISEAEINGVTFLVEFIAAKIKNGFCISFRNNTKLPKDITLQILE